MAFDAGMVAALAYELNNRLAGARVDKIQQPEKEEIVLNLRAGRENVRLSISSGANNPRVNITSVSKENPKAAPMFCMLLRKHLSGARILSIKQQDFERVFEIEFECRDEMGFLCRRFIIAEIMGKYSNIIFCDGNKKIISAVKPIDFTTSSKRQILPGMRYEAPPKQDKVSPLEVGETEFLGLLEKQPSEKSVTRFICDSFQGISSLVAREMAFDIGNSTELTLDDVNEKDLWRAFASVVGKIKNHVFTPVLIKDRGQPLEFSFIDIKQYGSDAEVIRCTDFSTLIDLYYTKREKSNRIKQRSADIHKLLTNNENRILKKIAIQTEDIKKSKEALNFKRLGDVITANIYMLKRGDKTVRLTDYSDGEPEEIEVTLDTRLTPAQNAQRFYKKYNKAKNAILYLTEQKKQATEELEYIRSVLDLLTRAESDGDIDDIRKELARFGYGSKGKDAAKTKNVKTVPLEFVTENGYTVLCGKNNIQNDHITFKLAAKNDYWFHVKNLPGSHVVILCNGEEPHENDFTQAAIIAATHSKASDGENVAVDYTLVKNIKKPNSSRPGFVTYQTNWTAYVTPDEQLCERLKR